MTCEILAVGSELLTPQRLDTNSLYLTQKLNELGVEVVGKSVVGDDRERLTEAVRLARQRVRLVILTGGLGPTEDDVTRDAVAAAVGRELVFHPPALDAIEARFRTLQRPMAPINRRQAFLIQGADMLPNDRGTAPGQWIADSLGVMILLPGPPNELKAMFEQQCVTRLRRVVPARSIVTRFLRVALMAESDVDQTISPVYTRYKNPVTTILAAPGDIQIHLRAYGSSESEARVLADELARQIEDLLGDRIYSRHGEALEEVVGGLLRRQGATLAVAESCTGGLLAQRITSVSGASQYFLGGWVAYSGSVKSSALGVLPETLEAHGAVSAPTATEMAEGARREAGATHALSITGVAGPDPDGDKPVGLVYIAVADDRGCEVKERHFAGDRDRVRALAAQTALDLLRRRLEAAVE
jgi:nicotinamide-nucleotide amidase